MNIDVILESEGGGGGPGQVFRLQTHGRTKEEALENASVSELNSNGLPDLEYDGRHMVVGSMLYLAVEFKINSMFSVCEQVHNIWRG